MWSVRVLSGAQSGQIHDLKLGKNVFGRGGVSDMKVLSLGISKEHCEIHVYKDKMMIVDLKSSNGTFVNGVKIQNATLRVGDKVSLFDVIMDIIPTPDLRPKSEPLEEIKAAEPAPKPKKKKKRLPAPVPLNMNRRPGNYPMNYPQQGGNALQMQYGQQPMYQNQMGQQQYAGMQSMSAAASAPVSNLTFQEKIDVFMEEKVMPAIYKLSLVFTFKQILQAFVLIFIFSVTLLSTIPLTNIIKESNLKEAIKRAQSVARGMAKYNEQALLSGQLANLSVTEALKEEGIKDAFIIQQSDGLIIAPPEKAGRDPSSSLVLTARKESRAAWGRVDVNTIGATFPISVYDAVSGEPSPKYHAIVTYDVSSLNFDEGRVVSLFMQTLIIASVLGLILYQLFARMIEFPIRSLNAQVEKAMLEKTDRTEVPFDYPAFQKLVSNVNTILNRAWSGEASAVQEKPQVNKDLEFSNLVEMISHSAMVIDSSQRIVALNSSLEQLLQITRDGTINQSYQNLTDTALVQNIESLLARSRQTPFEKQSDRIPFAQVECEIHCQVFLDANNEPQYFMFTLIEVTG